MTSNDEVTIESDTPKRHQHRLPHMPKSLSSPDHGLRVIGRAICPDCGREFVFQTPPLPRIVTLKQEER